MSSHRHSGTVGRVGVCGDGPARSVSRRRQRAEAAAWSAATRGGLQFSAAIRILCCTRSDARMMRGGRWVSSLVLRAALACVVMMACARSSGGKTDDDSSFAALQVGSGTHVSQDLKRWLQAFSTPGLSMIGSAASLPFSFSYEGSHSSALLRNWPLASRSENGTTDGTERLLFVWTEPLASPGDRRVDHGQLIVQVNATLFRRFPSATDFVLSFEQRGNGSGTLHSVRTLDTSWAVDASRGPAVTHAYEGGTGPNWEAGTSLSYLPLPAESLPAGTAREIGVAGGMSSLGYLPFAQLEWPAQPGSSEHGVGLSVSVGWAGNWATSFAAGEGNASAVVRVGVPGASAADYPNLALQAGERIRYARVLLVMWTSQQPGTASEAAQLHRTGLTKHRAIVRDHISPRKLDGTLFFPRISNIANVNSVPWSPGNESTLREMIDAMASTGEQEEFWVDDVWAANEPCGYSAQHERKFTKYHLVPFSESVRIPVGLILKRQAVFINVVRTRYWNVWIAARGECQEGALPVALTPTSVRLCAGRWWLRQHNLVRAGRCAATCASRCANRSLPGRICGSVWS